MRGKIKIVKSMLMLLTLLVSSTFMMLAVPKASAGVTTNTLVTDIIENPTLKPGDTLEANIYITNVDPLHEFDMTLNYDPDILTALAWRYIPSYWYRPAAGAPYKFGEGFTDTTISDINNAAGYVHMGASENPARDQLRLAWGTGVKKAFSFPYNKIIPGSEKLRTMISNDVGYGIYDSLGFGDDATTDFNTVGTPIKAGTELVYSYVGWDTALEFLGYGDGVQRTWTLAHGNLLDRDGYWSFGGDLIWIDGNYLYDENNLKRLWTIDTVTGSVTLDVAPLPGAAVEIEYSYLIPYTIDYSTGAISFDTAPNSDAEVCAEYEQGPIPYTMNYATGVVTYAYAPAPGVAVWADHFHLEYGWKTDLPFTVAIVTFRVEARGETALTLSDTVLKDKDGNVLTHTAVSGSFNNKFQGNMYAPIIKDKSLVPDSFFDVFITVDDVAKLYGYQFTLNFDPNVLQAVKIESQNIFTEEWANETGSGFARAAFSSFFGDNDGVDAPLGSPIAIAKVTMKVLNYGWSELTLTDTELTNVFGLKRVHTITDGSWANVNVLELAGNRLRVESRTFHRSTEEDIYNTIKTPIQTEPSLDGPPVTFKVVFTIRDKTSMAMLGTIESDTYPISAHTTVVVLTDFDTTDPRWAAETYSIYVDAKILYDSNGDSIMDSIGGLVGPFDFRVLP